MGKKIIIKGADFSAVSIEPTVPQRLITENGAANLVNGTNLVIYTTASSFAPKRLTPGELSGNYTIAMNEGYVIHAIIEYEPSITTLTPTSTTTETKTYVVQSGQIIKAGSEPAISSYTYTGSKKTIVVFRKNDADAAISPSENIGTIQYL